MTKGTYCSLRGSIARLTRDSDHFVPTFKAVVEHIHSVVLNKGRRHRHAVKALEILVILVRKTPSALFDSPLPLVDDAWITQLLRSAAGSMDDEKFTLFMRLSAWRREEEASPDVESSGTPISEDIFFNKVMHNIRTCTWKEGGWWDEAVYGGLITIRDIPGLGTCLPEFESLQMLSRAMEKGGDKNVRQQFRVRKAAYDVVFAARDGWLRSADLRKTLEDLDIPRKLHGVVIETGRTDHRCSFLEMVEILAEDRDWHSYLRKAMKIWSLLHHRGPGCVLHILCNVGGLLLPGSDGYNTEKPFAKMVEEEWMSVPGRHPQDLTVDRLGSLAEVTEQLKRLSIFSESGREAVLAAVGRVVPSLERRNDEGYGGPDDELRMIIEDLLRVLQEPAQASSSRSAFW